MYLAKVDNAIATGTNGLQWFKISEDGFDPSTAKWGVDHMIDNGGWQYFDMPTCVAPGQYLMRVELLALHSAYAAGGAQFYVSGFCLACYHNTSITAVSFSTRLNAVKSTLRVLGRTQEAAT